MTTKKDQVSSEVETIQKLAVLRTRRSLPFFLAVTSFALLTAMAPAPPQPTIEVTGFITCNGFTCTDRLCAGFEPVRVYERTYFCPLFCSSGPKRATVLLSETVVQNSCPGPRP